MSTAKIPISDAAAAPATHWHEQERTGHVVQFYSSDDFLLDSVSRFVGTALGAGDAAIVAATGEHRNQLRQRLERRGLDILAAAQQGWYISLDAEACLDKFMRGGRPDPSAFVDSIGSVIDHAQAAVRGDCSRVAIFGEMVALLWEQGKPEAALELERLWNELAKTRSFSLHCGYPLQSFDREEHGGLFCQICEAHSGVIPGESYSSLPSEEERLRSITDLQQKAQALQREVAEKREITKALQRREAELADFLENAAEGVQQVGGRSEDSLGQ